MKYTVITIVIVSMLGILAFLFQRPGVPNIAAPSSGRVIIEGRFSIPVRYDYYKLVEVQMNPGSLTLVNPSNNVCVCKTRKGIWVYEIKGGIGIDLTAVTHVDEVDRFIYEISKQDKYDGMANTWFPRNLDKVISFIKGWI